MVEGGERGTRQLAWPWQVVKHKVFTGLVPIQVLRGEERRLHFAGGSWVDFQEAVLVAQCVDPLKAAYDVQYEDIAGTWWTGVDGAAALMRVNANDAIQSFMAGKTMEDAIYLSGPEVAGSLTLAVPNINVDPAFAEITDRTGIMTSDLRLSGVTLSKTYVETREEVALDELRLRPVEKRWDLMLGVLRKIVDEEDGPPNTLAEAVETFVGISMATMLQNVSGKMFVGGVGQMGQMLSTITQMMRPGAAAAQSQPTN